MQQDWYDKDEPGAGKRKALSILLGTAVKRNADKSPLSLAVERLSPINIALIIGKADIKPLPGPGRFAEWKNCPACQAHLSLPMEFEFPEAAAGIKLIFQSQSSKVDEARLEWMSPFADDGQELQTEEHWTSDGRCVLEIVRRPSAKRGPAPATSPKVSTRADMETWAAENGLGLNPKWNDRQLATAIDKHKLQPAGK
jgi:hypothetical protein